MKVERYSAAVAGEWDAFVRRARNGLFLFERGYMDYHADRFTDASLLFRDGEKLVAVLPACAAGDTLASHGGLTFGGLVLDETVRLGRVVELVSALTAKLPELGFSRLLYKQVPTFFFEPQSAEDSYALFRAGARITRVDANFVTDLARPVEVQERRRRSAKKATKAGVTVTESADFSAFWAQALVPVLQARHGVAPVHSVAEIELLRARFPQNIRLFVATREGRVLAGTVLYLYRGVTHAQYIAANDEGRDTGALDLVFSALLENAPGAPRFFSFGISTEDAGRVLNEGLAEWKEGFGARAVPHTFYELTVST